MISIATTYYNRKNQFINTLKSLELSKVKDFDPKFDPRVGEQERLKNLTTVIEGQRTPAQQKLSLVDFEGRPFITSMSDRTAAGGELVKINDVVLNVESGRFIFTLNI